MNQIQKIYYRLFETYGPQYWWPTTIKGNIHPTYNSQKLTNKSRFEIALGAVLTQNTNWKNVEKAIANLNSHNLIDPDKIIKATNEKIENMIRPSGFYRIKTMRIKALTEWWLKNNEKVLYEKDKIKSLNLCRNSILTVYGVGQETADSILLYCYDYPTFVIDAYTMRIMNRHMGVSTTIKYKELRKLIMDSLPIDVEMYKEYHALLILLAKETCKKNQCLSDCALRYL